MLLAGTVVSNKGVGRGPHQAEKTKATIAHWLLILLSSLTSLKAADSPHQVSHQLLVLLPFIGLLVHVVASLWLSDFFLQLVLV